VRGPTRLHPGPTVPGGVRFHPHVGMQDRTGQDRRVRNLTTTFRRSRHGS